MISTVGIVVPATNEQAHIGECLTALTAARQHALTNNTGHVEVRILVALDSCVDGTAGIASQHPGMEAVQCRAGRAGAARAIGTQHILDSCPSPRSQIWLANTDADSHVPLDWITRMLYHAERGTHLVLGTVRPDDELDVRHRHILLGRHRPHIGHPHVHGANFGIRADTYLDLGGWPAVASGEDVAMAHRAAANSRLRIVRTAAIPVTTSSRLAARAPDGFAGYLRELIAETAAAESPTLRRARRGTVTRRHGTDEPRCDLAGVMLAGTRATPSQAHPQQQPRRNNQHLAMHGRHPPRSDVINAHAALPAVAVRCRTFSAPACLSGCPTRSARPVAESSRQPATLRCNAEPYDVRLARRCGRPGSSPT